MQIYRLKGGQALPASAKPDGKYALLPHEHLNRQVTSKHVSLCCTRLSTACDCHPPGISCWSGETVFYWVCSKNNPVKSQGGLPKSNLLIRRRDSSCIAAPSASMSPLTISLIQLRIWLS